MHKLALSFAIVTIACLFALPASASAAFEFTGGAINVADGDETSSSLGALVPGRITNVKVSLNNVTHSTIHDFDVMLKSPTGRYVMLMSDACGANAVFGYVWNFDDSFTETFDSSLASCIPYDHHPTNLGATDSFLGAVGAQVRTNLSWFNGDAASGAWRLFVVDDSANGMGGSIGSWKLYIDTDNPNATRIPATGGGGGGEVSTFTKQQTALRAITDVDLLINDYTEGWPDDIDFYLQSPGGTVIKPISDVCGGTQLAAEYFTIDDEAAVAIPDDISFDCKDVKRFKPTDFSDDPAVTGIPAATAAATMSAFDGQSPSGTWTLYVYDDTNPDIGYLGGFDLAITTAGAKTVKPSTPKLKYKKSGKKIAATGRVSLTGATLSGIECFGSVKTTFEKPVRKKGSKKTTYSKVTTVTSALNSKAGVCGFDISAKLAAKYGGTKLRVRSNYLGGDYITPFIGTSTQKIKRV